MIERRGELTTPASIKAFLLAGRGAFTLHNEGSGNRFTYRITQPEREPGDRRPAVHFVGLLAGPDNTASYQYLGLLDAAGAFRLTSRSRMTGDAPSVRAFAWFWALVTAGKALPPSVHVYHEGRCGRCGRALTVPESIITGLGPECSEILGIERATLTGVAGGDGS